MKVCVVVINSIWFDPRVTKQISEYSKEHNVVSVGLQDSKMNEDEIKKLPGEIKIVSIDKKYYRKNRTLLTKIRRELLIYKRIKKAIIETHANIIHANDLDALVPAYYASKKMKCRLVYDTHEIFLENHNIANSFFKKKFWSFFEKRIIKKVDCVVCVSHAAADYFSKKYNIKKKMVITNCAKSCNKEYKSKSIPKNKFEVLNHGQYYAGRGYDLMIEAAKTNDNQRITFVLRGFGSLEEKLRNEVKTNGLNNVRFDPPVRVYELIDKANESQVGLAITEPTCLNFELSVSNKIFEYAAAGLPVIMSDIPEHRFLNEKYDFGIVLNSNTPECLNNAIDNLISNNYLYECLSKNALKMSKELTWEKEFSKLIEFERGLTE